MRSAEDSDDRAVERLTDQEGVARPKECR